MNLIELNKLLGTNITSDTTFQVFNKSYTSDPFTTKQEWANLWKRQPKSWADFVSAIDEAWTIELYNDIKIIRNDYERKLNEYRKELAQERARNRELNNKITKITNFLNNQEDAL